MMNIRDALREIAVDNSAISVESNDIVEKFESEAKGIFGVVKYHGVLKSEEGSECEDESAFGVECSVSILSKMA